MASPTEVVERLLEAVNDGDPGEVAACLHDDFESDRWTPLFEASRGFHLEPLRSAVEGNEVWTELRATRSDPEGAEPVEVGAVLIVGIDGEKVKWARVYAEEID